LAVEAGPRHSPEWDRWKGEVESWAWVSGEDKRLADTAARRMRKRISIVMGGCATGERTSQFITSGERGGWRGG
jgi:hypothetical protein